MMKSTVKKVFNKFGYDIVRRNIQLNGPGRNFSESRSKGKIVELVGPSGIGKSTFFRSIFSNYNENWFSKFEIINIIDAYEKNPFELINKEFEVLYSSILKEKYNNIEALELSLNRKIKYFFYFIKEIENDAFSRFFELPKGMFSEDGLFHNFGREIIKVYHDSDHFLKNSRLLENLFYNRTIIFLEASPEYILRNLMNRSLANKYAANDWYSLLGPDASMKNIEDELMYTKQLIEISKEYQASVFKFNIETEKHIDMSRHINRILNDLSE